jgi:hypothetical protein
MLQSWENFMSPSGGTVDNPLEYGLASMGVEWGAMLAPKYLLNPLEKRDVSRLMSKRHAERSALYGAQLRGRPLIRDPNFIGPTKPYRPRMSDDPDFMGPRKPSHVGYGDTDKITSAYKNKIRGVKNKYASLRRGAAAIGWGYVALAAATLVEAITIPGVSKSVEMNNAKTMGMSAPLDSSQAYTQRQRALMAIHDSQLGIRNVIGSEAGYLHR